MTKKIRIEPSFLGGEGFFWISEPFIDSSIRAKGKTARVSGPWLTIKGQPRFTSPRRFFVWARNHFPRRKVERFLTAAFRSGKVEIEMIWEK